MKTFLEENIIVIVAESAIELTEDGNKSSSLVDGSVDGATSSKHSLLEDDFDRQKAQLASDKSTSFDIKVDPELFRKVEEAVTTMAYGAYVIIFPAAGSIWE